MSPLRVISLLPSATEIVCALGAESELVGISHECDFPETIRDRPVLTRSKILAGASSREIDTAVRRVLRDALSVYEVDEARLAELAPDVIVTQDLCEVCAVSLDDVKSALSRLAGKSSVELVSLSPTRLDDVLGDVERVATALGRAQRGQQVRSELVARVEAVRERAARATLRPRVATIEWLDPLMLGGTWMPELIELAGGSAVGAEAGQAAPTISREALASLQPDVVLIKPCGFDIARSLSELAVIERNILETLRGSARVFVSDGNAFFNRPGPRLVESLEILAAVVHPELFTDFALEHARWLCRM